MNKTYDRKTQRYAYMSGALTGLTPDQERHVTELYDRVEKVCKLLDIVCYLPGRSVTTPSKGIPHHKVWKIDYEKVVNSCLVIAYVGLPSIGVGCEIEMARTANVHVVLLCEEECQDRVSRLVLGNPAVIDIVPFKNLDEMEEKLRLALADVISLINLEQAAYEESWPYAEVKDLKSTIVSARNRKTPISSEEWKEIYREQKLKPHLF
ncbi:MAG: hypothetical protein M1371_10220 [Actinobacteria bacterium]|nr:hypothetical protein [Actinomycetota bacterium]